MTLTFDSAGFEGYIMHLVSQLKATDPVICIGMLVLVYDWDSEG